MRNRTRRRNAGRRLARPGAAPQPPAITVAEVSTIDTLTVVFDMAVTTADTSGWTFKIDGGGATAFDSVSGSGTSTLIFTVAAAPFAAGQAITVSYDPAIGQTVGASGVELAAVTDRSATNLL